MTATFAGRLITITYTVTEDDLATQLYSDLPKPPVLATARLLRWCERAAVDPQRYRARLDSKRSSAGSRFNHVDYLRKDLSVFLAGSRRI